MAEQLSPFCVDDPGLTCGEVCQTRDGDPARPGDPGEYAHAQQRETLGQLAQRAAGLVTTERNVGESWRKEAACRYMDPGIFYPHDEKPASVEVAKEICDECSVRRECLQYSLTNREEYGIWGGMTERERRGYWRQLRSRQSPN